MTTGFLDNVIFLAASGGTGDFVEVAAFVGYQTMEAAGAVNSTTYGYKAQSSDGSQWEVGVGTYSSTGPTLQRTTVLYNSLGTTAKINFTNPPQIMLTALAADIGGGGGSSTLAGLTDVALTSPTDGQVLCYKGSPTNKWENDQRIYGAPGTSGSHAGQPVTVQGGDGYAGNYNGGNVRLYGGDATGAGAPGQVRLFSGNAGTRPVSTATSPAASLILEPYSGYGGKFQARGGYGAGSDGGGPIFAFGGNSDSGKGGGFYSFAGNSTTGQGGALRFSAGSSTTPNTFGATCTLYGGAGSGGGFSVTSGADYGNNAYAAGFYCGGGSATGAGDGGTFSAFGGQANATGNGGYLTFIAGSAGGSGNGGAVNFYGGSSPSGAQGTVRLFGGGTDGLRPVTNPSAIAPASIVITGPPSSAVGGSLYLYAGHSTTNGNIFLKNLPTSAAGLPTGAVWNNGGVLNIAPEI